MGELAATLGRELAGEVRDDAYTRHLFAGDASLYAVEPLAVAFPRDADDVAAAVTIAARLGVPVIPRGGGTSLAGQTAGGGGLVIDTSRHMNAIDEISGHRVRVEPGRRPGGPQPRGAPLRARLRPGHVDVEPGHARRDDRQQLVGQRVDRPRHHDRSHRGAGGGARRRLDRDVRGGHAASARRGREGDPARARARDRRGLSEALAPVRRLPARPAGPVQPGQARVRVRGHAGRRDGRHRPVGRSAEGEDVRRRALRGRRGRDRGHRRCARAAAERGRDDRPHDPVAVAREARVPAAVGPAGGRPGRAAVRQLLRRHAGRGARQARRTGAARGRSTGTATTRCGPRPRPSRTR